MFVQIKTINAEFDLPIRCPSLRFTSPRFTSPRFTSPRFTIPVQFSQVREIQYAFQAPLVSSM